MGWWEMPCQEARPCAAAAPKLLPRFAVLAAGLPHPARPARLASPALSSWQVPDPPSPAPSLLPCHIRFEDADFLGEVGGLMGVWLSGWLGDGWVRAARQAADDIMQSHAVG